MPSFNGTVVSFDLEGDRKLRKGTLEGFRDGSLEGVRKDGTMGFDLN